MAKIYLSKEEINSVKVAKEYLEKPETLQGDGASKPYLGDVIELLEKILEKNRIRESKSY